MNEAGVASPLAMLPIAGDDYTPTREPAHTQMLTRVWLVPGRVFISSPGTGKRCPLQKAYSFYARKFQTFADT